LNDFGYYEFLEKKWIEVDELTWIKSTNNKKIMSFGDSYHYNYFGSPHGKCEKHYYWNDNVLI